MKKFLMFDFLITPWIIRIIYWVLQVIIFFGSLRIITGGNAEIFGSYVNGLGGGLLFLIVGSLALRLISELLIIWFKIAENTQNLTKENDKS